MNSNIKGKADYRTNSFGTLPPFALGGPCGIPGSEKYSRHSMSRSEAKIQPYKVTDNGPILRITADSALNNKVSGGNKFNKRVVSQISNEASPTRNYMGS